MYFKLSLKIISPFNRDVNKDFRKTICDNNTFMKFAKATFTVRRKPRISSQIVVLEI